jgi:hypothetical protein
VAAKKKLHIQGHMLEIILEAVAKKKRADTILCIHALQQTNRTAEKKYEETTT